MSIYKPSFFSSFICSFYLCHNSWKPQSTDKLYDSSLFICNFCSKTPPVKVDITYNSNNPLLFICISCSRIYSYKQKITYNFTSFLYFICWKLLKARTPTRKCFSISSWFIWLTCLLPKREAYKQACSLSFYHLSRSCYSFIFASFFAWSAAIHASIISWMSPFIILSNL